jgi:hypothetical protein
MNKYKKDSASGKILNKNKYIIYKIYFKMDENLYNFVKRNYTKKHE